MKKAVILLSHGSKKEEAKRDLAQITQALALRTNLEIRPACMQLAEPSFEQTVKELANDDFSEILVIPFFLTNGTHMQEDIPQLIEDAKTKFPYLKIYVSNHLWPDAFMVDLLEKRIKQSEIIYSSNKHKESALSPKDIEAESFKIIDNFVDLKEFDTSEASVVKRLIHTSGDFNLIDSITISSHAVEKGIKALTKGAPIITDVSMVSAGINKNLTSLLSVDIHNLVDDPLVREESKLAGKTRSSIAIKKLAIKYPNAIIAIGNAPTALFEVSDLINKNVINPSLVIAMPVGFVGTVQSKEAIKKTMVDIIAIEGNRGGSNLAAATINALLMLAKKEVNEREKVNA